LTKVSITFASIVLACAQLALAAPFVPPRDPQCVAFSPDGSLVALGFSGLSNGEFPPRPHPDVRKCGCVQIHDAVSGKRLRRIETYGDLVDLRFSSDGKYLAMARVFATGENLDLNEVRVWTTADGKLAKVLDRCHGFAFVPGEPRIVALGRRKCAEFDLTTGQRLRTFDELESAITVEYCDESRLVGVVRTKDDPARYTLRLVDAESGKQLRESSALPQPLYHVAVSPDGRSLATGFTGGVVFLWNAAELAPLGKLEMGTRGIAHPFFSPDGELVGAGDQTSGDVVIWRSSGGPELYRYTFEKGGFRTHYQRPESAVERPERDPARFVFSPGSDSFLSGCYGGIVRLVSSGQDVQRFGE
jgi:WD40 repeat protein